LCGKFKGTKKCMHGRICKHERERRLCKECGGSSLCEQHGRRRDRCKDCARGSGICEHGRQRSTCKDCGGSGVCMREHGRQRRYCKVCRCARAAADAQEKAAAPLGVAAALESETTAPPSASGCASGGVCCSECTFVSFCYST
jgi:hypothetical protein